MRDISIIIVNWNTKDLLARCLQCIYATTRGMVPEVIVVDNASSDGSVEMMGEQFPQVTVVANRENLGFAAANNQAIRQAGGRYLLLLNSDAFLHEGAIETMIGHMDGYPDTGAAGCRLYYEDGTLQRSCSTFPTLATELWQALWLDRLLPQSPVFGKYMMTYWDMDHLREVDCVLGACMIIRREAMEQVGLLDEDFFMYSEEVDFCYRLKKAGWQVRFVPDASATHVWGGSARKVQAETLLRLYRSRVLFFRKHYGEMQVLLYKAILLFGGIVRIGIGPLAGLTGKGRELRHGTHSYRLLLKSLHTF
jgi:GT2 family glycosyltransferase